MYFDETNNYFDIISNEENINFDNYVEKINTNLNVENVIFNRHNASTFNIVEGFNKGNMFNKLYSKYKNHVYNLKVNNKRDELLYKIQMYNFAVKDLGIYLDLHPTETKMIELYKKYNIELSKLKKQYNEEYVPLSMSDLDKANKWTWINNPWPWDKGGNI